MRVGKTFFPADQEGLWSEAVGDHPGICGAGCQEPFAFRKIFRQTGGGTAWFPESFVFYTILPELHGKDSRRVHA